MCKFDGINKFLGKRFELLVFKVGFRFFGRKEFIEGLRYEYEVVVVEGFSFNRKGGIGESW